MKAIYSIVALCSLALLLAGCGMLGGTNVTVNANTAANGNATAATNSAANAAPAGAAANASNANANVAKTDSGPKRISFSKGADWASESITLAGGQSKQFIVGAGPEQYLTVEASSPDIKLLMISKKGVGVEQEGSTIGAVIASKGDYIFEVRNPGTKEVKTSIKVQIRDEGGD